MRFGEFDIELLGGFLDVGKGLVAFGVGNVFDLIEAGDRVADVGGIVERLLALLGKGEGAFVQAVALVRRERGRGLFCGGLFRGGHGDRMGARWGMLLAR